MSLPINMRFRAGTFGWLDTRRAYTISASEYFADTPKLDPPWKGFFKGNIPDSLFCKDLQIIESWMYNSRMLHCKWNATNGQGQTIWEEITLPPYNSSTGQPITTFIEYMTSILQLELPDGRGLISYRQPGITPSPVDRYVPHVILQRKPGFIETSRNPKAFNIVLCPLYAIGSAGLYHLDLYETSGNGSIASISYAMDEIRISCPNFYQQGGRTWIWNREGW